MKCFSLFDSAASAYSPPFYLPTQGVAIRQLQEAKLKSDSPLSQHSQDFTLYELGEWEAASGLHKLHREPVRVIGLTEV